jgi:hypothetical protein
MGWLLRCNVGSPDEIRGEVQWRGVYGGSVFTVMFQSLWEQGPFVKTLRQLIMGTGGER